MMHKIKLREDFADAVLSGDKSFEVRKNDRGYKVGDTVKFRVIDKISNTVDHPLNKKEYRITYVLNEWGIDEDYVVFAIKEIV